LVCRLLAPAPEQRQVLWERSGLAAAGLVGLFGTRRADLAGLAGKFWLGVPLRVLLGAESAVWRLALFDTHVAREVWEQNLAVWLQARPRPETDALALALCG
jgi:hypothetical protein